MKDSLRNMTWIFVGIVMGSIVNLCLVSLGMVLIPPPGGLDLSDPEVLKDNIKLLPPKSFLFPWLAHALGTLIGAFLVARYAAMKPFVGATVIAAFFLNGGLMMVLSVGGPKWFIGADLLLAYLPMAFIGGSLGGHLRRQSLGDHSNTGMTRQ